MDRVLPPTLSDVARPAMPCPAAPSIAPPRPARDPFSERARTSFTSQRPARELRVPAMSPLRRP